MAFRHHVIVNLPSTTTSQDLRPLSQRDVFFRRGTDKVFMNNPGNLRFRDLINRFMEPYNDAKTFQGKREIVATISNTLEEEQSRLFRVLAYDQGRMVCEPYIVGGKISQTLRDAYKSHLASRRRRRQTPAPLPPPGNAVAHTLVPLTADVVSLDGLPEVAENEIPACDWFEILNILKDDVVDPVASSS